ncbi:putative Tetratricopeptide repeat protein 5 [Blattamonas nauphoetae]|uniref:Tetratricopeptide repeat protein 5 n=1 Tax=Blattamonas nauphoetae TaxID=2049346 RepID=A0ABQ9XYY6_9EUKA|nr:putative Tetratricopeptide repeat protein 5 [Blattamonas nauphoetae]
MSTQSEITNEAREKASKLLQEALKFNPEDNYHKDAETKLEEAIRLVPAYPDALTYLGCTKCNKGDVKTGISHLKHAVQLIESGIQGDKNTAYISLSVAIRSDPTVKKSTESSEFDESIALAKKAITNDINDGKAWYTLGMAYLSRFFIGRIHPKDLRDAVSAFTLAEKKPKTPMADLRVNRGTVLRFLAMYHSAREDYEEAIKLDPTLVQAKKFLQEMKATFDLVDISIGKKIKSSIPLSSIPGSSTAISKLGSGTNKDRTLMGYVVEHVTLSDSAPQMFVLADKEGSKYVLVMYDVTNAVAKEGDSISVEDPNLGIFSWDGIKMIPLVMVEDLNTVLINGKGIPDSCLALPELK